ncbi:MAG: hypothetical protein ACE5K2_05750 [Candidatus Zixiibacteriota bacterium]
MIIVSDASPIISLARAGLLGLLRDLFHQVVIPFEVYQEVVVQGKGKAGAQETESADWIMIEEVKDRHLIGILQVHGLSMMDAATIALAREKKAHFVII